MSARIFLSYSSRDAAAAEQICSALEGEGLPCWIAPRDILPSQIWGESIIDAIDSCAVMVVVISEASNRSPQVVREVERAVGKGLQIVPLRLDASELSKAMQYLLSTVHWFDAARPPLAAHLPRLVETLRRALGLATEPPPPTARAKPSSRSEASIGAEELRRISALQERAQDLWAGVAAREDRFGIEAELEEGERLHAALEAALAASRFTAVAEHAEAIRSIVARIESAVRKRTNALEARRGFAEVRALAEQVHAPRLAARPLETAERFARQGEQCHAAHEFDLARDHWVQAAKSLRQALPDARAARAQELRGFAEEVARWIGAGQRLEDGETRQRILELARSKAISNAEAKALVRAARGIAEGQDAEEFEWDDLLADGSRAQIRPAWRQVVKPGAKGFWPLVVLLAYLALLSGFFALLASPSSSGDAWYEAPLRAGIPLLVVSGFLFLPVRVATRRPVGRRSIVLTASATLLLFALLGIGSLMLLSDAFQAAEIAPDWVQALLFPLSILVCVAWPLWAITFWRYARRVDALSAFDRACAWLVRGSILELLVAVPVHVWVRHRNECSVGMGSALAIAVGLFVAFVACGPGLVLLFAERAERIRLPPEFRIERRRSWTPLWLDLGVLALVAVVLQSLLRPEGLLAVVFAGLLAGTVGVLVLRRHVRR